MHGSERGNWKRAEVTRWLSTLPDWSLVRSQLGPLIVRRVAGAHCCAQAPSERYVSLSSSYRSSLSNAPFDWRDAVSPRVHPGCAVAYGNWGEAGRGFLSYLYHLYFARSGGGCAIP